MLLGAAMLFLVARTGERNAQFQWVDSLAETAYALYVKSDSPVVLASLKDAKRLKSIAVYGNDTRNQTLTA